MTESNKPEVLIFDYRFVDSPYSQEKGEQILIGRVLNHPRIQDGHRINSSKILKRGTLTVETLNTNYRLVNLSLDRLFVYLVENKEVVDQVKKIVDKHL